MCRRNVFVCWIGISISSPHPNTTVHFDKPDNTVLFMRHNSVVHADRKHRNPFGSTKSHCWIKIEHFKLRGEKVRLHMKYHLCII